MANPNLLKTRAAAIGQRIRNENYRATAAELEFCVQHHPGNIFTHGRQQLNFEQRDRCIDVQLEAAVEYAWAELTAVQQATAIKKHALTVVNYQVAALTATQFDACFQQEGAAVISLAPERLTRNQVRRAGSKHPDFLIHYLRSNTKPKLVLQLHKYRRVVPASLQQEIADAIARQV